MIKLSEQDTALLEKKLEVLKRYCACPDGFNYAAKATSNGIVFISLQVVTYDGEVYQKDIYLSSLHIMNEPALKEYARNYLK